MSPAGAPASTPAAKGAPRAGGVGWVGGSSFPRAPGPGKGTGSAAAGGFIVMLECFRTAPKLGISIAGLPDPAWGPKADDSNNQ